LVSPSDEATVTASDVASAAAYPDPSPGGTCTAAPLGRPPPLRCLLTSNGCRPGYRPQIGPFPRCRCKCVPIYVN